MNIDDLLAKLGVTLGAAPGTASLAGAPGQDATSLVPPAAPAPAQPHMLDRAAGWLRRQLGGDEIPRGFEGLLSPDDVQAAKPSLLHLLGDTIFGGPTPEHEMAQKMTEIAQRRAIATSMHEQQRILQARRDIGAQFAPTDPNETSDQAANRSLKMFNAYMGAGDFDAAKVAATVAQEPAKKLPPQPLEHVDSGGYTSLIDHNGRVVGSIPKTMNPEQLAKLQFDQSMERSRMNETQRRDAVAQDERAATLFNQQNKTLLDKAPLFDMWKNVVAEQRAGNPASYEPFIFNFASMVDPQRIQPRQGLIQMLANLDPSLKGKSEIAIQRITHGVWPQRVVDAAEELANKNMADAVKMYHDRFTRVVSQHPNALGWITPTENAFGNAFAFQQGGDKKAGDASKFDKP